MRIRKMTLGGLMLALAVLLPQTLHFLGGGPQIGQRLLPMHLPVLLCGFILGPLTGLAVGLLSPLLSFLLTGMPMAGRLPFMMLELAAYGWASGFFYRTAGLRRRPAGVVGALLLSMLAGRLVYALSLLVAAGWLGLAPAGAAAAVSATVDGAFGILLQLILIPCILYILRRSGYDDAFIEKGKKPSA